MITLSSGPRLRSSLNCHRLILSREGLYRPELPAVEHEAVGVGPRPAQPPTQKSARFSGHGHSLRRGARKSSADERRSRYRHPASLHWVDKSTLAPPVLDRRSFPSVSGAGRAPHEHRHHEHPFCTDLDQLTEKGLWTEPVDGPTGRFGLRRRGLPSGGTVLAAAMRPAVSVLFRSSAGARRWSVVRRGRCTLSCSRLRTARTLRSAFSLSSSWVSPAMSRYFRISLPRGRRALVWRLS